MFITFKPRKMSEDAKKHSKGGGYKKKAVDNGSAKKRSLLEFPLNTWKDLRPALEEGATADFRFIFSLATR